MIKLDKLYSHGETTIINLVALSHWQ